MKQCNRAAAWIAALLCASTVLCSCMQAQPAPQSVYEPERTVEAAIREAAFITIDINPSIELIIDENHKVTALHAANAEAEVMLWEETGIVGEDLETALSRIAALAVQMGYITEEYADISITVTTETGETEDDLLTEVKNSLTEGIGKSGVEAHIEEAVDLVLAKELERVKRENEAKAGYDETLTLPRYRLIRAAMQADRELTMDEAVTYTNEKLTDIVERARKEATEKYGEAYELAQNEALFIYENAKQTLLDSAYTSIYTSRRNLSSLLANYGAAYAGYRLAYRTIEHYAATVKELIENPILTSDDVFALANALGIDTSIEAEYDAFLAEISDEEGHVTKERVDAYINRLYKSMSEEDRARIETVYNDILKIYDRLSEEAAHITEEGRLLIKTAMIGLGLSFSIETYEDIDELLEAIQKKIDDTYARMDEDMTENEKGKVADLQKKMNDKIAEYEKAYKESIAKAKQQAEEHLNDAKRERNREEHDLKD